MPTTETNAYRRRDHEMTERVQCGLRLLYSAGATDACRHMAGEGISAEIIDRVIYARRVRGARVAVRIDCYSVVNSENKNYREPSLQPVRGQDLVRETTV